MCTLIGESIGAFIVVERGPLLVGLKILVF